MELSTLPHNPTVGKADDIHPKFSSTDLTDYSSYSSQINIGKCDLTNEGLDANVALRGSDDSALM